MATVKSTRKRPLPPWSRQARYEAAVVLLQERILPSSEDLFDFSVSPPEEHKHLFELDYLRSCVRIPLPPTPRRPPRRLPKLKARPVRELKVHWSPHGYPCIRVEGRWLEETGFPLGAPVLVKVEQGRLVVELASGSSASPVKASAPVKGVLAPLLGTCSPDQVPSMV
jgi:hypothetical protein